MDNKLRKYIQDILREIFDNKLSENPEVMPQPVTKPQVKPTPAPVKTPAPQPRRILKPSIHPGADPAPKAKSDKPEPGYKKKIEVGKLNEAKFLGEKLRYQKLISESPLGNGDTNFGSGPNPHISKSINTNQNHPYKDIPIFHKDTNGKKTIQKIGQEEFDDVKTSADQNGMDGKSAYSMITQFQEMTKIEQVNRRKLEALAKNTVQKYFGVPDEVMENILAILQAPGNVDGRGMDDDGDDDEMSEEDLIQDFTPEEQNLIKQHVDKRIITNALIMGAGFKSHNLLDKIQNELNAISPKLFPLYKKIMSGANLQFWQTAPKTDMKVNKDDPNQKNIANVMLGGKAELIIGEDNNGDGIREVEGAKAEAIIFPVLLHEVVKAVLEYIFANGLPQFTTNINRAIMSKTEKLHYEHWHKLLGPRLWKYLHDAIDYIVHDREADYTIVAYLLQEISVLPPNKFIQLIDYILHDGQKAIEILTKMLDGIEDDMQNGEAPESTEPNFAHVDDMMDQIQALLNKPVGDQSPIFNHKPFNEMTNDELMAYNTMALDQGEYDKAAEARDEMENRGMN